MFLRSLEIFNSKEEKTIRRIEFIKGINLILDETDDKTEDESKSGYEYESNSGNNVGKTTVLKLIDFCLGGTGKNIYKEHEFNNDYNELKAFLAENKIEIILKMSKNFDDIELIEIKRNFYEKNHLNNLTIDGKNYRNKKSHIRLSGIIFGDNTGYSSFRNLIKKFIRYEKKALENTVNFLHENATNKDYEAMNLSLLGLGKELGKDLKERKKLSKDIKNEKKVYKRLELNESKIIQSLSIFEEEIKKYKQEIEKINPEVDYQSKLDELGTVKNKISNFSSEKIYINTRIGLIKASLLNLKNEKADIDDERIADLYKSAEKFFPQIQKTFQETLNFHNSMIEEKINFIAEELPRLEKRLRELDEELISLKHKEHSITKVVRNSNTLIDVKGLNEKLNISYEKKGECEEQKRQLEEIKNNLEQWNSKLDEIQSRLDDLFEEIQKRIKLFNFYFTKISEKIYGEKFILSAERKPHKKNKSYEYKLDISSLNNESLGTGKKKTQIAAFDFAYFQFADELGIQCPHFVLYDQIEGIHGNQITTLYQEIIKNIDCQVIIPVLKDKLPENFNTQGKVILTLSQKNKLFKFK